MRIIKPDSIIEKNGNVIIITPTHSKEYELVGYEIYDMPYCSQMPIVQQPTKEAIEREYFKNIQELKKWVKNVPVWVYTDGRYCFDFAKGGKLRKLKLLSTLLFCIN